jgi:hypothetical protein
MELCNFSYCFVWELKIHSSCERKQSYVDVREEGAEKYVWVIVEGGYIRIEKIT